MANDVVVDKGRRRFLTATTAVVGGAGVVLAAIPGALPDGKIEAGQKVPFARPGLPVFVNQTDLATALAETVNHYPVLSGETGVTNTTYPYGDVRRFGALGDGVADDTAAFNAAVAALPRMGGTIYLSLGSYVITSQLLVSGKTGVKLQGASKDGCAILKKFTGNPALHVLNANHFQVDSIFFQGLLDAGGTDPLIYVEGSSHGRIANCKVFNARGYGVKIEQGTGAIGSYFNMLEGNHFFNNGRGQSTAGANIYCGVQSSETKVIGGECQSCGGAGWLIEGGNGHTGLGASFEGNGTYGVKVGTVSAVAQVALFGCRFEGGGVMQYGVHISNANSIVGIFGCHLTANVIGDVYNPDGAAVSWAGNISSTSPVAYSAVGVKTPAMATGFDFANGFLKIINNAGVAEISGTGGIRVKSATNLELASANSTIYLNSPIYQFNFQSSGQIIRVGSGSPEGTVSAPVGSLWLCSNGGPGTCFYVKESGAGNTGWVAK